MPAILIISFFAVVFGISYYLNHKTPVPKGTVSLSEGCGECTMDSCSSHPSHKVEGVEK